MFLLGVVALVVLKLSLKSSPKDQLAVEKKRQRTRTIMLGFVWMSAGFALASAISVNQVTSAMDFVTENESVSTIHITAGKTLIGLQWATFSISVLFAGGILAMIKKEGGVIQSAGSARSAGSAGSAPPPAGGSGMAPPPPPF
ncbi:uncharacterized protein BDZ99DRAFT_458250 [Mytilinidion resinicola]|uniref:Uncharacterized protein n=1 Tax=Mytilinidion resinicola TaxID=574789 RepID=A0A6A6Z5I8_9PEZI|nr:uncharacterized protein BDZ99DRAFT_458250 [Mytilinidion resinicola]KAF2816371.1 hypothetical protein BDZ99DRAFT_458250 [Mytilinidion resinicola]